MKHIESEEDKYYLVDRVRCEGGWIENKKEITDDVIISELDKLDKSNGMEDEYTYVPCFNPNCNHVIKLTKKQKRDLLLSFQKKYKKVVFVTCCDDCQKTVLKIFNQQADEI
jgi:hypothetical protein